MISVAIAGWNISVETILIGALTGLTYAVLAAGLVLVYRATRVVNFAHGEIGAFGAAVLAILVTDHGWPFLLALLAVTAVGGLLGAAVELIVVRRLFAAPRLILLVATIGVTQLIFVAELVLPEIQNKGHRYPTPIHASWHVGNLVLNGEHFMVLVCVPIVIGVLAFFLNRTPYGLAIRACADNADRAELAGISTKRISTMVWVIAGALSTLTAVLINPVRGVIVGVPILTLGPGLLLRALVAAMIGGFVSLPLALLGGVIVGVVEAVMFVNIANPGAVDLALFVAVIVLVLVRPSMRSEEASVGSLAPKLKAVPVALRSIWWVRRMNLLAASAGLVVAVLLPVVFNTQARSFLFAEVVIFALIGLSITVLTGWAGQLSLGQFAFVGLGAMVCAALQARGMGFPVSVAYATAAGVIAAIVIGFPALRVRGLFLGVITLGFAVATRGWLLGQPVFLGDANEMFVPRGKWGFVDLHSQRTYYYVCLAVLVAAALAVAKLRNSGIGRTIIAVRENEAAAASFTVSPTTAKLTAFALAGGLAALAGGLFAGLQVRFSAAAFGPEISLQVVAMAIIGGLGSVAGAIIGAVYVVGLPALFGHSQTVGLATSGIGLLIFLLYLPGGLMQAVYRLRDALLGRAAKGLPPAVPAPRRVAFPPTRATDGNGHQPAGGPLTTEALRATGVTVSFGGVRALDNVDITAQRGEVVGLIGSNGAGKSTLLNVISGYIAPQAGRIEIAGTDVSHMAPHERARLGVGRVFQDARLFGDLTLTETIKVALEAHERSETLPSMLALPPSRRAEARKDADTAAFIDFVGLGRYADSFVSDLSTGTRRIVELCCLLAQRADVLLLDEPTAGVAQRETEAFGPLIKRVQRELNATIVIIEHDIPLVMSISDRVYCLAAGQSIAEGQPDDVRSDPKVVAAYLGTDERAIQRSGAAASNGASGARRARAKTGAAS